MVTLSRLGCREGARKEAEHACATGGHQGGELAVARSQVSGLEEVRESWLMVRSWTKSDTKDGIIFLATLSLSPRNSQPLPCRPPMKSWQQEREFFCLHVLLQS